ncbi:hypothetical protein Patl1_11436 [Pistacia atlantica]|uniref:Uncharacterized protein n=1 Tax=Pistacia atlantica TaxID=434234 RepID=A0ACC1A938_9ROSI|nr:hypothetical protein Patl1_11436 [Pistacia atlantica]
MVNSWRHYWLAKTWDNNFSWRPFEPSCYPINKSIQNIFFKLITL